MKTENEELLSFIEASPTAWHTVENISAILRDAGYSELFESEEWMLKEGGRYFVTRNGSSLIAFRITGEKPESFMITASHGDSPSFRVKGDAAFRSGGGLYFSLNTEKYGGMICASWMDRPLTVAGRAAIRTASGIRMKNVYVDRDLLLIPSLAIHMDRSANDGKKYEANVDMIPLMSVSGEDAYRNLLAEAAGAGPEEIVSAEMVLVPRTPGTIWGAEREFVSSPRLDDLQCVYGCMKGFIASEAPARTTPVFCVFDNEEVGSGTAQGADSTFLEDTLRRISESLGKSLSGHRAMLASSFLVSADNAHAVHPNHPEFADRIDRPVLNGGVVIKHNAAKKYTTDGFSSAVFEMICRKAGVPVQQYSNRADLPGGSTLGHISTAHVSVDSVDIGLAQLAMHSCYETAGVEDTRHLIRAITAFYGTALRKKGDVTEVLASEEENG
jgi:aspartyl aminopeptidase